MTTQDQALRQCRADQPGAQHQYPQARLVARRALASGSLASVLSTFAVCVFSRCRSGSAAAGTNAASQCFWYPRARHVDPPSPRYTLVGYGVHHASSLLWACAYETLRPRTATPVGRAARASAVAAAAYLVDYHVVPRRFSPGFEHRIGPVGMLAAYGAFALGLYVVGSGGHGGRLARAACTPRGEPSGTTRAGQARSCLLPPMQRGESGAAPCADHSSGV